MKNKFFLFLVAVLLIGIMGFGIFFFHDKEQISTATEFNPNSAYSGMKIIDNDLIEENQLSADFSFDKETSETLKIIEPELSIKNIFEKKGQNTKQSIYIINNGSQDKLLNVSTLIEINYSEITWAGNKYQITEIPKKFTSVKNKNGDEIYPNIFFDNIFNKRINYKDFGEKGGYALAYSKNGKYYIELKINEVIVKANSEYYIDPTFANSTNGFSATVLGAEGIYGNNTDFWIAYFDGGVGGIQHANLDGSNNSIGGFGVGSLNVQNPIGIFRNSTNELNGDFFIGFRNNAPGWIGHYSETGINQTDGFLGASSPRGIDGNSTDLFFVEISNPKISHKTYAGTNLTGGFPLTSSGNADPYGMQWNGSDFWVTDGTDNFIYHYDTLGNNLSDGINLSNTGIANPLGLWMNGSDLWTIDDNDNFAYNLYCLANCPVFPNAKILVNLNFPLNNAFSINRTQIFNATITPTIINLTNATLRLWYANGSLAMTNSTTFPQDTNTIQNISLSLSQIEFGNYLWNVQSFGFETANQSNILSISGTSNFSLEIQTFQDDAESWNNNTFETKNETFRINISTDSSVSNIGAFLIYNGTSYPATHTCSNNVCQIFREIDIPLINHSGNSSTKSFHWTITTFGTFGTSNGSTTSANQNVSKIFFIKDGFGTNAVNFSIYNESDRTLMTGSFKSTFKYWLGEGSVQKVYNISSSGTSSFSFFIDANNTYYVSSDIRIENTTNTRNYYFLKEAYTNVTTNQELFIPNTDTTNFVIEVKNQGLIPLENYWVKIFRYYPETDQHKLIAASLTDEFGQFASKLVENNVKYKFEFYNPEKVLQKTSDGISALCKTSICIIPFVIEIANNIFERFQNQTLFDFQLIYTNSTNEFIFSWDDQRQESSTMRLYIERFQLNQSVVVCNSTSTSSVSALTCLVGSQKASYNAKAFRMVDGEIEKIVAILNIQVGDASQTFGVEGLFWIFILLFTCIGIGAFNPSVGAALYGFGFVAMGIAGIISMPMGVFFANTLLVIIFIWAVRT